MELILNSFNVLATSDFYPETYKLKKNRKKKKKKKRVPIPLKMHFSIKCYVLSYNYQNL